MNVRKLVMAALLTAIILVMALTSLGYIPLFGIDITLICIPVIIGTCALGPRYGLFFGLAFGLTSLYMALIGRAGPLLAPLLNVPWAMYPSIFLPRLLVPVFTYLVYKATAKWKAPLSYGLAAIVGSLTNTVFFLGFVYVLGAGPLSEAFGMSKEAIFAALAAVVVSNGLPEAAAAVVICVPVMMALKRVFGHRGIMQR